MNWEQSLLVSDYGPDKKWIAIKKMTKSEQKEAQKGVEQEVEQQEQGASSPTDALERPSVSNIGVLTYHASRAAHGSTHGQRHPGTPRLDIKAAAALVDSLSQISRK